MSDESEKEKLDRFVRDTDPSWRSGPGGIRGLQPERISLAADQVHRSDPGSGSIRREPPQPAFPEKPNTETSIFNADSVDLYGANDGEPATFHLFQSSPPTPFEPEEP